MLTAYLETYTTLFERLRNALWCKTALPVFTVMVSFPHDSRAALHSSLLNSFVYKVEYGFVVNYIGKMSVF